MNLPLLDKEPVANPTSSGVSLMCRRAWLFLDEGRLVGSRGPIARSARSAQTRSAQTYHACPGATK